MWLIGLAIAFFLIVGIVPYTGLYRSMTVLSGSMKPSFWAGDLVLVREAPTSEIGVGDVVVYRIPVGDHHVEAHRISRVMSRDPFTFRSKGDANAEEDPWTAEVPSAKIAHVVTVIPYAGWVVNVLRKPWLRIALVYLAPLLLAAIAVRWIWTPSLGAKPASSGAKTARRGPRVAGTAVSSAPRARRAGRRRGRLDPYCSVRLVALVLAGLGVSAATATLTSSTNAAQSVSTSSCFYKPTVQSGSTTSTANGTRTVTITSVDPTKAFLLWSSQSNLNRPVASEIGGRIANGTTIEFIRATDEASPVTVTIQWYVVEYGCGVSVQRGSLSMAATTNDVTISSVGSTNQAFLTWSKTPSATDIATADNDPIVGELTSPTNAQFRVDTADSGHTIYWQVVAFTDSTMINVQHGTTSLASGSTSTTATLGAAVTTSRAFVLADARSTGDGVDIGSGLVRARLTSSTQVTLDRAASGYAMTEIAWQAIELRDGSIVQSGNATLGAGTASSTPSLTTVDTSRATAIAAGQPGAGQNGGRTSYTSDDVVGSGTATVAVTSSTQLTVTRGNTSGTADIPWFVIEWGRPTSTSTAK